MKDTITPLLTLLLATSASASIRSNDSRDDGRKLPSSDEDPMLTSARDILTDLTENVLHLGDDPDWTTQIKCTADMSDPNQPTVIDENACKTAMDASSKACVWCDLTAITGSGLCLSPDQKSMMGQFWDVLCSAGGSVDPAPSPAPPVTPPVPVVTSKPTDPPVNPPTPPPVAPAPAPAPAPDNGGGGLFDCAMDSSSNLIANESTCVAQDDPSSTMHQKCVWCDVYFLGGSCITNAAKQTAAGFLCKNSSNDAKTGNLRKGNDVSGWNELDPSCLGDSGTTNGFGGDKDSCGSKTDVQGNPCIWCDGGGVFGLCVSSLQTDAAGSFLECGSHSEVETSPIATE